MLNQNLSNFSFALGCSSFPPLSDTVSTSRLLLVDDEPRILDGLSELLGNRGYDLTFASSGREALKQLTEKNFDLLLLDLRLPDVSGHEIMDFINLQRLDITIIVISGETGIDAAIGALQRGAYGYLRKPYSSAELFHKIDNAIQKRLLEERNRQIAWRLEYSEKLYRNLVDNSPDIIYTLDKNGRFTFINERAQQVLGFSSEDLIGQHYTTIVHEEDLARAHFVFNERRSDGRASRNVELRLRRSNSDAEQLTFKQTLSTISFNSIGMYQPDGDIGSQEYFGTYVVARDITERKRAEELIAYQAYHDILTDLPNRTLFKDQLSLAIIQARRSETKLAVMIINIDRFKPINDALGHMKGDELLQKIALRLKECMLQGTVLARHGGDEFTVILPCIQSRDEVASLANEIVKCLKLPFVIDVHDLHITASIGIAIFKEHGESINELLRHADIAMYQVKSQTRDGFAFYDESMQDVSQQKISRENSLRNAINNNELEMYYQPQTDISSGRIVGAEALMRWNHPERGLLSAGEFLPFAEESGLMLPLSDWMLNAVCRDVRIGLDSGCKPVRVAINVSPQWLDRGNFFEKIQDSLQLHNIPPELLEVEITENIAIRNPQHAIDQLNKLSKLGICVAIDDFGTGYSSLAYLHRFPINTIKIDQVFVREIQSGDGHFPVALAIISIARGLELNLIAEGVETEGQVRYLKQAGCQVMQGYFFHRPMPRGRLFELLKEQAALSF